MQLRHPGVMAACVLLGACAAPPPRTPPPHTNVSYQAVADQHATHYQVSMMQSIVSPTPAPRNAPPVYPPALIVQRLPPVTVRVKLIVGADGQVTGARFAGAGTDDAAHAAFDQAVRAAVLRWHFAPLLINQWVALPDGGTRVVKSTPKPFSQDYEFTFRLIHGKPVVTPGAVPAPAASRG